MYGVYGNFEVRFSFSIRQRIDYLNAHKATHPLAADVDIVGGLHVIKPLILCKLGADPVGGTDRIPHLPYQKRGGGGVEGCGRKKEHA